MNCINTGRRGEDLAVVFLLGKGYRILARNWRTKMGEIDIVAERNKVIVFCEVKTRTSKRCGGGAEAVHRQKQLKIIQVALLYLQKMEKMNAKCRFDVLEVNFEFDREIIRHIENAFVL